MKESTEAIDPERVIAPVSAQVHTARKRVKAIQEARYSQRFFETEGAGALAAPSTRADQELRGGMYQRQDQPVQPLRWEEEAEQQMGEVLQHALDQFRTILLRTLNLRVNLETAMGAYVNDPVYRYAQVNIIHLLPGALDETPGSSRKYASRCSSSIALGEHM